MKSDPKAAVASEKKAATQLGVIIGMSKSIFVYPLVKNCLASAYT